MMNEEIKARWLERLRSGNYQQGTGYLKRTIDGADNYCCLGVLCEIAVEDGIVTVGNPAFGIHAYASVADEDDYDETVLPDAVARWAGIDKDGIQEGSHTEPCPEHGEDPDYVHRLCGYCHQMELTELNDSTCPPTSFNEIANVIEKWF